MFYELSLTFLQAIIESSKISWYTQFSNKSWSFQFCGISTKWWLLLSSDPKSLPYALYNKSSRNCIINVKICLWLRIRLVDFNGKAKRYIKIFSSRFPRQFTFLWNLDLKNNVTLAFKGNSNDICIDAILIKPNYKQLCLIPWIFVGIDVSEKYDREPDFEFCIGIEEVTRQKRIHKSISNRVVLIIYCIRPFH